MSFFKKFADSSKELSHVQTLAVCAMMLALRVVLGIFSNFTLAFMPFVKIGFTFIPIVITAYLYGPVCAAIVSGAGDILSIILANPTAFSMNPALTACYVWEGIIYGVVLYKSAFSLKEIIIAKTAVLVLCALPLNTLVLSGMMNIPYLTLLLYRAAVLVPFGVVEVLITRLIKPLLDRINVQNRNYQFNSSSPSSNQEENYGFHYFISFLVPLAGIIIGSILLSKETEDKKQVGKTCLVLSIISLCLVSVITFTIII